MRSRQNTGSHSAVAPRRAPARARGRRRTRPAELVPQPQAVFHLANSPEAVYRAEKARRTTTTSPDADVMAEAKRLYDEAIAETGKKRAGMRTAVVPPARRRTGGADPVDPTADSAEGEGGPSGSYEADQ